jgi:hypothetical protein
MKNSPLKNDVYITYISYVVCANASGTLRNTHQYMALERKEYQSLKPARASPALNVLKIIVMIDR